LSNSSLAPFRTIISPVFFRRTSALSHRLRRSIVSDHCPDGPPLAFGLGPWPPFEDIRLLAVIHLFGTENCVKDDAVFLSSVKEAKTAA
jgi:hypothetical protein